jgi:DNA invertase Pin-like site-specific DNA recombinase
MSPAHFGRFVAYYRVSTDKQGRSGLGLDAQKAAVRQRLDGGPWKLIDQYTEIESGRRKARPELTKALAACKKHKAKLVVAKLDRLSRNAAFLLTLLDSGVEVLFCDMPQIPGAMGRFVVGVMAQVAELEAGLVGERTRAALAAAKQRGARLGRYGAETLAPKYRAEAKARAEALAPVVRELQAKALSLRGMAAELTKRKVPTPTGGKWHPQLVSRILGRLANLNRPHPPPPPDISKVAPVLGAGPVAPL